ncbi:MAG: PKD domain-containing protein [Bacteroidota bacterium]|nr:PKD domain-containing protein [Bacteroidota bacterium]
MKKIITKSLLNLLLIAGIAITSQAQQSYLYDFKNTLNEVSGSGPALNVLGTGAFVSEALSELSCISRPVYGFTQNSGVQFDNAVANDFIGSTYSVEMYFQFLNNAGFKRLIDFKNQASDSGLYCTSTTLEFYNEIVIPTTAFVSNQYVHLAVSRDGTTDEIVLYVDGAVAGSFIDNDGIGLLNSANVMNFFRDDLVFGGEAQPGRIALLRIHDSVISAGTVASNYNGLQATSGTLAFTSDISSACLNGNVFNFTNESDNTGSYTYTWEFGDGNSFTGNNAVYSYSTAGIFDVLLIADNGSGCIDTVAAQVAVSNSAPVNLGPDIAICDGDSAILDAGVGFASYLWNTGSVDVSITVTNSGIYSVEVTDSTGCTGIDSIVVDVLQYPLLDLGPDASLCFGETLTLNATPGLTTYLWSTGDTTESITVGTSGIYFVDVANAAGCSVSDTLVLTVNPEIILALGNDTSICAGSLVILDAGPGFQAYLWSDGTSNSTLNVTLSGTYAVTVTDLFSCTASDSIVVTVNSNPIVDLGADTTFCGGNTVILDPGASFVGYQWSDGSQNPTLSATSDGIFSVIVTDSNGCTGTDSITLIVTPVVDLGPDFALCDGLSAILDAGSPGNIYLWNDGTATQTLNVSVTGTYTVTVTDNLGCFNQDEIEVSFNPIPVIELGPDFDICDGEIGILDPGTGFPSYLWSDGSTDSVLLVTAAGTYSVIVSSAPNCSATDSITISVLPSPVSSLSADTLACDGSTVTLDAGAGFDTYEWSTGSTNQTLDVTVSGTYAVTITNSVGCETLDSIVVTFEGPAFLELGPDQTICDGTATVLDAGAGMATYLWNDGSSSQMLLVFANGTYSVTITSLAGCTSQDSVSVSVLNSPVVTLGTDTTLCAGDSIVLDAGAGFNAYTWSDGTFLQTITVTNPGVYTIVVTDGNNCNGTDDIEVLFHAPVPVPVITQNLNTLISSAATGNQWYSIPGGLIPGETNQTFNPSQDGTYYVIVTDSNGCVSPQSADFIFVLNGLNSHADIQFTLMPNPANDFVSIATTGLAGTSLRLEVSDILGKIIYLNESVPAGSFNLNVTTFVEGVYIIKLNANGYQVTRRLVISR